MGEEALRVQQGAVLGWACILLLAVLQVAALLAGFPVAGQPQTGLAVTLIGATFVARGLMVLASYYFPQKTFFFRGLMWLVERSARPRSRKWAYFWVVALFVGGAIAIFRGLGVLI